MADGEGGVIRTGFNPRREQMESKAVYNGGWTQLFVGPSVQVPKSINPPGAPGHDLEKECTGQEQSKQASLLGVTQRS